MGIISEKYRPSNLNDVVGQKHVTDFLKKFVKNKDIPNMLFSGPAGTGKCVTKDSLIFVNNTLMSFEEYEKTYQDNDLVLSENKQHVKGIFHKESVNKIIEIQLEDGNIIKGTPEHKIKVLDENKGIIWKKLDELQEKDCVLVSYNFNVFSQSKVKHNFEYIKNKYDTSNNNIPTKYIINEDIGYFIGCLIANGTISKKHYDVVISTHKLWLQNKLLKIIKKEFHLTGKHLFDKRYKKNVGIRILSRQLKNLLKELDVNPLNARDKYVPLSIRKSPKLVQISFLKGLFECDGYFNNTSYFEYYTSSKKLCFMIRNMLMNSGIYCNIRSKYLKKYNHNYWTIHVFSDFTVNLMKLFDMDFKNEKVFFKENMNTNLGRINKNHSLQKFVYNMLLKYKLQQNGTYRLNNKTVRVEEKYSIIKYTRYRQGLSNERFNKILNMPGRIKEIEDVLTYIKDNNIFLSNVKKITYKKQQCDVYDFHIPKNHTFICNNLINHNTTTAIAIAKELYGDKWKDYFIEINASDENSVDTIRSKIKTYAKLKIVGQDYKIIFFDEMDYLCLSTDTKIITGWNTTQKITDINDIPTNKYISIPSLNLQTGKVEKDKGKRVISGERELFEVELEDSRKIKCSMNHKFFIKCNGQIQKRKLSELKEGDKIVDCFDMLNIKSCKTIHVTPIKSINSICKQKSYDITMQKNSNFFLGNGILTHNSKNAQACLRRIIETSKNTRFIFSCNYSNKVIQALIDRCVVFRFKPIKPQHMKIMLDKIVKEENIDINKSALYTLATLSNGSMRRAINTLEKIKKGELTKVDDDTIYEIMGYVNDEFVLKLIEASSTRDIEYVNKRLMNLLYERVYQPEEIIESLTRLLIDSKMLSDDGKSQALKELGTIEYRIAIGSSPEIQLRAFIAYLMILFKKYQVKKSG